MKNDIVNLEIAMHKRSPILGLQPLVIEKGRNLVKVRQLSHGFFALHVDGLGLHLANGHPRLQLSRVEARVLAKLFQPDLANVHLVEAREHLNRRLPQRRALLGAHTGHGKVLKDAAVEKLHDVKWRADDAVVLAERVRLGDGNVGVAEGVDDAVLAVDTVRRLGEELPWWLLAHDKLVASGVGDLICRVGLAKTKLEVQRKNASRLATILNLAAWMDGRIMSNAHVPASAREVSEFRGHFRQRIWQMPFRQLAAESCQPWRRMVGLAGRDKRLPTCLRRIEVQLRRGSQSDVTSCVSVSG